MSRPTPPTPYTTEEVEEIRRWASEEKQAVDTLALRLIATLDAEREEADRLHADVVGRLEALDAAARTPDVEAELDVAALADAMRFGFAWIAVPEPHEWPRVAGFVAREYERQMAAARAEASRRALALATPEARR